MQQFYGYFPTFIFKKRHLLGWLRSELNFAALQRGKWFPVCKTQVQIPSVTYTSLGAAAIQLHYYPCSQRVCARVSLGPACSPQAQLLDVFPPHLGPTVCVPGQPPHTVFTQAGRHLPFSRFTWSSGVSAWLSDARVKKSHHHDTAERVARSNITRWRKKSG